MTDNSDPGRQILSGSSRAPAPDAHAHQPLEKDATVEFTVVLRRREDGELGAAPGDLDDVTSALTAGGLDIVSTDAKSRRIRVRGPASAVTAVFGTELQQVTSTAPNGSSVTHRQRTGDLSVPGSIAGKILAVLGIDDRPQARGHFRAASAKADATSYTPVELGDLYKFPADTDGTGQTVAIIELGGGFSHSDLSAYFTGLGVPNPHVKAIGVDGAKNVAGKDPQGADGEVLLDIEVVGALAPKAAIHVYFAPNTDDGFLDAISEAVNADPTPAAVSISWGQSEDAWTAQARTAMDAAFADAVQLGVVVTAAAGDNGSSDGATDGKDHCDFPASSPNVLSCGGTSLQASNGTISSETVWNNGAGHGATGGGVSDTFPQPAWQADIGVPKSGRGVPDVSANADPNTGYQVRVDGTDTVIGGTSAVAPLWAALAARFAQATGGLLTNFTQNLYAGAGAGKTAAGFQDITSGDNGSYSATQGWDACTGLGSPDGTALLARLQQSRLQHSSSGS